VEETGTLLAEEGFLARTTRHLLALRVSIGSSRLQSPG
jgi:hypothetical protein